MSVSLSQLRYVCRPLTYALLCLSLSHGLARAEDRAGCGRAGKPWVALAFTGDSWQPALRDSVTADLRAGLRLRGIDVCALGTEGSETPLALVQLGSASSERVSVSIDVHDAITEKRVLRDVNLRDVTADGRGLTLAQAAEELLRASWAELALEGAPKPAAEAPAEVTAAVTPARVRAQPIGNVGARFAAEYHTQGQTLLGADAFVGLSFSPRLGCELAIGGRQGLAERSVHGEIDATALVGALELSLALLPAASRVELLVKLGGQLVNLQLRGRPTGAGVGDRDAALGFGVRSSLLARVALVRGLLLAAELGPGLPMRAVSATDAGHPSSGTLGVQLHAALGLGVAF